MKQLNVPHYQEQIKKITVNINNIKFLLVCYDSMRKPQIDFHQI